MTPLDTETFNGAVKLEEMRQAMGCQRMPTSDRLHQGVAGTSALHSSTRTGSRRLIATRGRGDPERTTGVTGRVSATPGGQAGHHERPAH